MVFDFRDALAFPVLEVPKSLQGEARLAERQEFFREAVKSVNQWLRASGMVPQTPAQDACVVPWIKRDSTPPSYYLLENQGDPIFRTVCSADNPTKRGLYAVRIVTDPAAPPSSYDGVIVFQAVNTPDGAVIVPTVVATESLDFAYIGDAHKPDYGDLALYNEGAVNPDFGYPMEEDSWWAVKRLKYYVELGLPFLRSLEDGAQWIETGYPPLTIEESGSVLHNAGGPSQVDY